MQSVSSARFVSPPLTRRKQELLVHLLDQFVASVNFCIQRCLEHGITSRASRDVDLFLKNKTQVAVLILKQHGFKGKTKRTADFAKLASGTLVLDVSAFREFPLTETVFRKSQQAKVKVVFLGKEFPALPIEEIVLRKLVRNNALDTEDVRAMLAKVEGARGLDKDYLEKRFSELGPGAGYLARRLRERLKETHVL